MDRVKLSQKQNVVAFGDTKTVEEWLRDPRSGVSLLMSLRERLKSGMDLSAAIETPRKRCRELTIPPGTRRGKLVTRTETRIGPRRSREVLCDCDCGQQEWREIKELLKPRYSSCGCSRAKPVSEEKKKERNRRWEAANRDHRREYQRQWKQDNPEAVARAAYLRSQVTSDPAERTAIGAIYKTMRAPLPVVCSHCGRITLSKTERHIDHRIPKSRGGGHFLNNLAIACTDCNLRKHAKTELEFLLQEHVIEEPLSIG